MLVFMNTSLWHCAPAMRMCLAAVSLCTPWAARPAADTGAGRMADGLRRDRDYPVASTRGGFCALLTARSLWDTSLQELKQAIGGFRLQDENPTGQVGTYDTL